MNPALARRAYDGPEGTIDLVPGPGRVSCVVLDANTGERITSTGLVGSGGAGFIRTKRREGRVVFCGVLARDAVGLRVTDAEGNSLMAKITEDDAYWISVRDVVDAVWVLRDGTERRLPAMACP